MKDQDIRALHEQMERLQATARELALQARALDERMQSAGAESSDMIWKEYARWREAIAYSLQPLMQPDWQIVTRTGDAAAGKISLQQFLENCLVALNTGESGETDLRLAPVERVALKPDRLVATIGPEDIAPLDFTGIGDWGRRQREHPLPTDDPGVDLPKHRRLLQIDLPSMPLPGPDIELPPHKKYSGS